MISLPSVLQFIEEAMLRLLFYYFNAITKQNNMIKIILESKILWYLIIINQIITQQHFFDTQGH
jgi:hypothetical protein